MMALTPWQLLLVAGIAALGHVLALVWYVAGTRKWKLCQRTIYELPLARDQTRRELRNSIHAPMHALIFAAFLALGSFQADSWPSFVASGLLATLWAEIWHYASHRAFHLPRLHWIHVEHHKSRINTPFTAISFSFT